ncbi:MAG: NAD(P)-binding protein [Steroidobacteraceae bacterium]
MKQPVNDTERGWLGLDAPISRRDFLNGSLAAVGSALALPADSAIGDTFTGYGGVGDYSLANGNTWPVVRAAHRLRDGGYSESLIAAAGDAGQFDLVVVGGGIAGLSAAHRFRQLRGATARILILENHAMPGGEARQNEFDVEGIRLLAPQGSNDFGLPGQRSDSLTDSFFEKFALPREYQWQRWDSGLKPLRFARDNYSNMDGFQETQVDVGYFFDRAQGADQPCWRRNIWSSALKDTPYSDAARRDLLRWRANHGAVSEAENRYLDTLTYREYLENVRGYDPAVTRMVEPIVGLLAGVSTDAACARLGRQLVEDPSRPMALSFPGGNSPFPRALLRALLPAALPGRDFDSLLYGNVDFRALDGPTQSVRMRLDATALRLRHSGGNADEVVAVYEKGGRLFNARAGQVVRAFAR